MHKGRPLLLYCLSGLLFLGCFRFGLLLAEHKPLWNDEIYTQVSSVDRRSFSDHLLGRISEGNTCPLFYSVQKIICGLWRYQTPDLWKRQNLYDRLILRLNPVLFMAASLTCIFFYFSRFYSLLTGIYSFFISISSFIVWVYWAEARPYTLWIFLTTLQSLYFLYLSRQEKISPKAWAGLSAVHFLLSLAIVFSAAQIIIVSGLLWICKERNWKKYILSAFIPVGIALFYYSQAPRYDFFFDLTPEQLIRDCFSRERFYILFIFIFFLGVYYLSKRTGFPKSFPDKIVLDGILCFSLTVLMLMASFGVLAVFKIRAVPYMQSGFPISSRYFVYLTPIGIVSTTLLSVTVFRTLAGNRWVQILILAGIGYLVVHRFFKLLPHIKNTCVPIFF